MFVVKANTEVVKVQNKQNYDRKSVTVEHYLNVLAAEENVNLSKALSDLLREKLIQCLSDDHIKQKRLVLGCMDLRKTNYQRIY